MRVMIGFNRPRIIERIRHTVSIIQTNRWSHRRANAMDTDDGWPTEGDNNSWSFSISINIVQGW